MMKKKYILQCLDHFFGLIWFGEEVYINFQNDTHSIFVNHHYYKFNDCVDNTGKQVKSGTY